MTTATPLNGHYRRILLTWLAFAVVYIVVPPIALVINSRFYFHLPLPLTHTVLTGAAIAAARFLEEGVRTRAAVPISGSAAALVAATALLYVTLTYCPR